MTEETVIRVRLDTKPATQALDGLLKQSKLTSEALEKNLKDALSAQEMNPRQKLRRRAVGLAKSSVSGVAGGSFSDLVGEQFLSLGRNIEDFIFGDTAKEARAQRSARQQSYDVFALQAGILNREPPGARQWMDNVARIETYKQKGQHVLDTAEGFSYKGIEELLQRFIDGIGGYISAGFKELAKRIFSLGMR